MLNRNNHENTMRNILDDIYSHKELSNLLGFKGGTACYFFYDLPRFSTDLDFNLLNLTKKETVFNLLPAILEKYGEITDKHIKTNTIFFYLSHTPQQSGIKIEISTRELEKINNFELLEFYGTSYLVMKKQDIFANKLLALTNRHSATPRDLFDINFFFSQNWDISENIIQTISKQDLITYLNSLPDYIEKNFNQKNILMGLGELVNNQAQRDFIKNKLVSDTINSIRFFIDSNQKIS
jgi:predicted nucleotidyltransferase component of viral defense system